ncbi:hypothetical protein RhiirA5_446120 [Rhizophagus irregularis]|uniref:Uncharacterized protein n=1 Tax=Rhizophagus irregularis TaxID=588596 RepID=A0A2N0NBX1_9GLOM|nr:hypothetical protein RhiirA5_446120 [Rhizophagus irregularis]
MEFHGISKNRPSGKKRVYLCFIMMQVSYPAPLAKLVYCYFSVITITLLRS